MDNNNNNNNIIFLMEAVCERPRAMYRRKKHILSFSECILKSIVYILLH